MATDRLWIKCRICGQEASLAGQYGGIWGMNAPAHVAKWIEGHSHDDSEESWRLANQNFEVSYEMGGVSAMAVKPETYPASAPVS